MASNWQSGGMLNWSVPPPDPAAGARAALAGHTRLHLGCGNNVIAGWANVDADAVDGVIAWDLRRPLPAPDASFDYVFSEHFIEHVTRDEALRLLRECVRVLRPGGVLRTSTPDLRKLVSEYLAGRLDEWRDVAWLPQTPCRLLNEGMRSWGHQFVYDEPELRLLLAEAGFANVERVAWRESTHDALRSLECRPLHDEIIVEARR
jgi:predicted SAM-dependent methyltransferase